MTGIRRPRFSSMSAAYPIGTADDVLKLIGGKVEDNNFSNTCAIRVSRSLNYSGHFISYLPPNLTVSGSDGKWYIYRVVELIKYLEKNFGPPDVVVKDRPRCFSR